MATLTTRHFDTLGYVKEAKALGASEALAELQARKIEEAIDIAVSMIENKELATKNDIVTLRQDLIAAELRLVKWLLGTGVATFLGLAGLLKYMVH